MREAFRRFAGAITAAVGTPCALLLAIREIVGAAKAADPQIIDEKPTPPVACS